MQKISINGIETVIQSRNSHKFLNVQCSSIITNHSAETWNFLKVTICLLNSEHYPVEQNIIYEKVTVKPSDSFDFNHVFKCIPIKLLGSHPDFLLNVTACQSIHLAFEDTFLPGEPYLVKEIKPIGNSQIANVLNAGIWKNEPDENRSTLIQSFFQLQIIEDVFIPQVRLEIDIFEKDGGYIGLASERKEVNPYELFSLQGLVHVKERKLNESKAIVNIYLYKALASKAMYD